MPCRPPPPAPPDQGRRPRVVAASGQRFPGGVRRGVGSLRGPVSRPAQRPAYPCRRGKMAPAVRRIEDRGFVVRSAVPAGHGGRPSESALTSAWAGTGSASVGPGSETQRRETESLAKPVPPGRGNTGETPVPPAPDRPLAIGVVGLKAVVEDVQVYRDVYYTSPVWPGRRRPCGWRRTNTMSWATTVRFPRTAARGRTIRASARSI